MKHFAFCFLQQSVVPRMISACAVILAGAIAPIAQADLKVATLHPLMTDVANKVGGSHVTVVTLMSPGEDIHQFSPTSSDMTEARSADVVLASGKGVELYLPKLKASLPSTTHVIEAGNACRSIKLSAKDAIFACCPQHAAGSIDPHWWHSISGMQSAADYVAKEFGKADPANKDAYRANAKAWSAELKTLQSWAKREISKVPRSRRYLVTSHAAFGYFCKEYGFKSIPISGPTEEAVSSQYLSEAIEQVKANNVTTVFPENNASTKALDAIIAATGTRRGSPLIADGSASGVTTYKAFVEHNISAVVDGLGGS
ncbi:MAG: zinc ABC transporter substrate-binding protein [Verrucomicrobiae bacterium]|nr:zinc ABC transporter substrate-binding protein [Verrucomicrobiae bacterium]